MIVGVLADPMADLEWLPGKGLAVARVEFVVLERRGNGFVYRNSCRPQGTVLPVAKIEEYAFRRPIHVEVSFHKKSAEQ